MLWAVIRRKCAVAANLPPEGEPAVTHSLPEAK
jgi:hypothetical protein